MVRGSFNNTQQKLSRLTLDCTDTDVFEQVCTGEHGCCGNADADQTNLAGFWIWQACLVTTGFCSPVLACVDQCLAIRLQADLHQELL